ncbi:hypothetical protein B0H10DRAFT_1950631 [Mycena sp. CBHHK59/15]|nr:hypothetical protein B0H10DRAFT_1950631 [Mycena sp. CBHHK59/15]
MPRLMTPGTLILPSLTSLGCLGSLNTSPTTSSVPVPSSQEFLNATIGRALVEWNIRIGSPLDVWHTISTGYVRCEKCDLVRSFEADQAHRNARQDCQDIGQGQTSAIVKGKSRTPVFPTKGLFPCRASLSGRQIPDSGDFVGIG